MFFRVVMCSATLALVGCGNRIDPGTTGTTTGGTGTGQGTGTATGAGTGTGSGTGTGTGTGTGGFVCDIADEGGYGLFTGHPIEAAGGSITPTPPAVDAGLSALDAAINGEFNEIPIDVTITGAIVTARDYVPATNDGTVTFWFEDANFAAQAYRVDVGALGIDPLSIEPGDTVDMHATMGVHYFGTLEVTAVDSITFSHDDNPVYVTTVMAPDALDPSTHRDRIVEVYGQLVSDPTDCGGRNCFDFEYNGGHVAIFRLSTAATLFKDDCIHYIGPLGEFSGTPQLNVGDFDWYRWW